MFFRVFDEIVIDVEIFAGDLVAREYLREARVDARRRAGDKADVGVRSDGHERGIAHALLDLCAQKIPVQALVLAALVDGDGTAAVGFEDGEGVDRHHAH